MNNKTQTIRWGIIGVGDVTEIKSGPAFKKTDNFEITAVMRRSEEKAADYAKRHGIHKFYTSADQLIHDPHVDAVYIATPPDSHKQYALKVAAAGKPCCVEKPMAPNFKDSKAIVDAFEKKNLPLFVSYYRRSLPRFLKIKEWLEVKLIGKIRHIHWQLTQPPNTNDLSDTYVWRTDKNIAPGGYFDDLASHGLDLFTYYFGSIIEANGISLNQQGLYSAKDAITANWLHTGGITGSAIWNFGCNEDTDKVDIFGSDGTISFAVFKEEPIKLLSKQKSESYEIPHPENVQLHHVENIAKALRDENYNHPSTGVTGLHTAWVMDQILKD